MRSGTGLCSKAYPCNLLGEELPCSLVAEWQSSLGEVGADGVGDVRAFLTGEERGDGSFLHKLIDTSEELLM